MDDKKGTLYYGGYSGVTAATIASSMGRVLSDAEASYLTRTIAGLELTIARLCNRNFLYTTPYFEIFDGGCDRLSFRNFPVEKITKVIVDGVTKYDEEAEENDYQDNTDFFLSGSDLEFALAQSTVYNKRAVKVHYMIEEFWGEDIKLAITQWATDLLITKEYAGKDIKKFTFTTLSVEFQPNMSEDKLPPYVREVINTYRVPVI